MLGMIMLIVLTIPVVYFGIAILALIFNISCGVVGSKLYRD